MAPRADVLAIIGGFGRYHALVLVLSCLRAFPVSWTNMMTPLMAPDVPHWCAPPVRNVDATLWKKYAIPVASNGKHESCHMFRYGDIFKNGSFVRPEKSAKPVYCMNGWVFNQTGFGKTATEEWNLVCHQSWKRPAMQSLIFLGSLVGVAVFGKLSDHNGRKVTFYRATFLLILSAISATFSQNLTMFNMFRFLLSMTCSGLTVSMITLFIEMMPFKDRIFTNIGFGLGDTIPVIIISLLSYALQDFRFMQLSIGLVAFALLPFFPFVFESPKWLLAKHKLEHAEYAIREIIKFNGRPLPNMDEVMPTLTLSTETESAFKSQNLGYSHLLNHEGLRRNTLLLMGLWLCTSFNYYYIALNAHRLPGNPHLNFAISAFSEVPACLVSMSMLRGHSRRFGQVSPLAIGLLCFLGVSLAPDEYQTVRVCGKAMVRFFLNVAMFVKWVAAHEVLPTAARSHGFALCMMANRIGASAAPFLKDLGHATHDTVPIALFSLFSLGAIIAAYLLPETLNRQLPDTLQDVVNLRRDGEQHSEVE
ncbi:solute carrier family 22 member 6-B-like [Tropilaelaps mercedesae]|uniref:Solute carrier family 22 member 6-B-like n=1 Tax=Tropilaelaps mercedesae TaxID=418985 RepID=A0A1V9XBU4_9ACAR|nr:solute carrier family 22 member 6-B-like [Tropilaelaps mercedesae]